MNERRAFNARGKLRNSPVMCRDYDSCIFAAVVIEVSHTAALYKFCFLTTAYLLVYTVDFKCELLNLVLATF